MPFLVQQASSTSLASTTITAPADIIAGDLLVIHDQAGASPQPTTVVPTGFTSAANSTDSAFARMISSYKLADGSEASAVITGMVGTTNRRKMMLVFRGSRPITALALASVNQPAMSANNPTLQTVTASGGTPPLVVFGAYFATSSGSAVDPRTFSTTKDGEINADTFGYLAWKSYNSAPANTDIDMDDEGNLNGLQSFYIEATIPPSSPTFFRRAPRFFRRPL